MNKNIAFIVLAIAAVIGLAGIFYIAIERPDASATFTSTVVLILAVITGFYVTVANQAKVTERLTQVEENTNGKNTKLQDERDTARDTLARLGLDADGNPVTGTTDVQA